MASKRSKRRTSTSKRKKTKKNNRSRQFLKIPVGLIILTVLVLIAGILTHHMLVKRQPLTRLGREGENNRPSIPAPQFEIYPPKDIPRPKPETVPTFKPETSLPRVAIILDDIGYDRGIVTKFLSLDLPLTLSMLPKSPFESSILAKAQEHNIEIMLHQPMEPFEYPRINPGPGALLTSMSPDELVQQFIQNLDEMPFISGVNNHMGSKMTASSAQMRQLFTIMKKRNLYFIDSRTTEKTICRDSADILQLPFGERDIFIDHFQDNEFIEKQLYRLVRIAETHGVAIGIAHPYRRTYKILRKIMADMKEKVQFVPVSEVAQISG